MTEAAAQTTQGAAEDGAGAGGAGAGGSSAATDPSAQIAPPENLVDLLGQLVEAPDPAPVPWIPQTWGWWVLAALLLAGIVILALRTRRRRRENAWRRAALAELEACGDDPAAIAAVIRRAALAAHPRREAASLTGEAWLAWLDEHAPPPARFAEGPGRALADAPWRSVPSGTAAVLRPLAADWIRRARPHAERSA